MTKENEFWRSPTIETARAAIEIMDKAQRRTGRTLALLASVRDGDAVIFSNSRQADQARKLFKERGMDRVRVYCATSENGVWEATRRCAGQGGAVLMDHAVQSVLLHDALDRVNSSLARLAQQEEAVPENIKAWLKPGAKTQDL